jgi:hypothetical protein
VPPGTGATGASVALSAPTRRYNPPLRSADLKLARQAAANAHAGLESARARIRELETIAETLNRRLCEANQRAQTAESRAAQAIAAADRST